MAKKTAKIKRKGKKTRGTAVERYNVKLDRLAHEYAKLISNPCDGPLVHGIAPDGGNGFVQRVERDFICNETSTAALCVFMPGLGAVQLATNVLTPTTNPTYGAFQDLNADLTTWGSFRCLSACMQLYWPGTELNRSGIASLGQVMYTNINNGTTTIPVDRVRTQSTYVERVPENYMEIKWVPSEADLEWNSAPSLLYSEAGTPSSYAKHSCLVGTFAGIPNGTGMRVRLVAVYEWLPAQNFSSVVGRGTMQRSNNTLSHVLNYLDQTGDWVYKSSLAVANTAANLYRTYETVGKVGYGVTKMAARIAAF